VSRQWGAKRRTICSFRELAADGLDRQPGHPGAVRLAAARETIFPTFNLLPAPFLEPKIMQKRPDLKITFRKAAPV
jgi:hypothetical protein